MENAGALLNDQKGVFMAKLTEINTKSFIFNPFSMIEDDWFLITSMYKEQINTMTAASGALGHMFRKNVAYINIRPERYTHEFVDHSDFLSLSFFDQTKKNKRILSYLGSVSGRDENKIQKSGLTLNFYNDIPYFEEAHTVFLCRPLYKSPYIHQGFIDSNVENYYYPNRDYHDLYICEIIKTFHQS